MKKFPILLLVMAMLTLVVPMVEITSASRTIVVSTDEHGITAPATTEGCKCQEER
jgi:hypothetical protein